MKYISFLTSRGFAVGLLIISIIILVLWSKLQEFYSPFFLLVPGLLFLSMLFCVIKRFAERKKSRNISFYGSMIFHAGMLAWILSTALMPVIGFYASVALPQGFTVDIGNGRFAVIDSRGIGDIPAMSFKLDWQRNRYEGQYVVERAAGVTISMMTEGGYKNSEEVLRINSPVSRHGYGIMLEGGALSPLFIARDNKGAVVFDSFVNLSNETAVEDSFKIPVAGIIVHTRFFPDVFKEGNEYGTRSSEPKNPAFGIRAVRNEEPFKDVWKGVVKKGEVVPFDGLTLEFADIKPVVTVQVVKDPTYWGIYAGWLLIVAGLVIRYAPFLTGKKDVK